MSEPDPPAEPDPDVPPPPPGWGTPPPQQPYGPPHPQAPPPPVHGAPPPYGWPEQQYGHPYGQPYGQQYGGYGPGGFPPGPVTNQKAQWSLAVGLLSVPAACCSAFLGLVGILAIVLGVQARREITASGGQQTGDGLATTGIVTGAIGTVIALVLGLVLVMLVIGGELLVTTS
jgi:hypothetical protein